MNNLNRILLNRLKQKHQKLSNRFLKAVEEGNFQQLNGRKKYQSVERLKKIERQLKDLGQRTGNRISLPFKHWAVALALGVVVTSTSLAQEKPTKTKFFQKVKPGNSSKPEAQNVFFTDRQQLGETYPYNFLVGDLDGDGDDDAIYVTYLDDPILITNDGSFNFTQSKITRNGPEVFQYVGLNDIDGDGDLDLITIRGMYYAAPIFSAYLNSGSGTFTHQTLNLSGIYLDPDETQLMDVDGDGDSDIAYMDFSYTPATLEILENNNFAFTPLSSASPFINFYGIRAIGDMDADSDIDIIYEGDSIGYVRGIRMFENDGSGIFSDNGFHQTGFFEKVEVGDLDNDNDLDIIAAIQYYPNVNIIPYLQSAPNVFAPGTQITAYGAEGTQELTVTDLDGDGNAEVIIKGQDDKGHLFQNLGSAIFASEQVLNGDIKPAELDATGDMDLFVFDGNIGSYQNQGAFSFNRNPSDIIEIGYSEDIDLVDIDNDGDLDIVQASRPTIWMNDGTGNFTFFQEEKGYNHYRHEFGDLDGDGDPDMIALPKNTGVSYEGFTIWRADAGNIILNNNIGGGVFETTDISIANMDGDADLDIVVTVREGSTQYYLRTYLNQGSFSFSQGANITLTSRSFLAVGDVDGDTNVDAIVMYNNDITTYLNDGTGNLTNSSTVTASGGYMQSKVMNLVDVDGDNDLDIFVPLDGGDGGSLTSYIFLNNGSGVFTQSANEVSTGSAYHSAAGDFDGDGDNDLITTGYSSGIQIFLNDGAGIFTLDDVYLGRAEENTVPALGDVDGDGDIDIVLGGKYVGNKVWFNGRAIEGDSLALAAFYQATDGANWTDGSNWLSGNVDTWFGVGVTGGRVTDLNLPNNNVSGIVPSAFENLTTVTSVDLSDNAIEGFETDMAGLSSITSFNVSGNYLDFGDFELIGAIPGLVIGNQLTNDQPVYDSIPAGSSTSFSFIIDGTNNVYQWYRNGVLDNSLTSNTVDIAAIDRNNMGEYYCEATNTDFPGLTLTSATKTVLATAVCTGTLNISETNPATVGELLLMKVTNTGGFDTTNIAPINSVGEFIMNDVILGDYILAGKVDTTAHPDAIPTYFGNTVFWAEADTLFINGDINAEIVAQFSKNPTGDIGNFFGYLEQEFPDGGKTEARARVSGAGVGMRRGGRDGKKEGSGELVYYVYTNENGEFNVDGIAPGLYNIDIQYPGYPMDQNSFLDITIGSGDKDKEVSVEALVDKGVITVRQLIILGTEEVENGLLLFPNPTKDFLQIQDAERRSDLRLELYNSSGQSLKSFNLSNVDKVSVTDLPVGQYIVTIFNKEGKELLTRRIIVQY